MNIGIEVEFTGIQRLSATITLCNALGVSTKSIVKGRTYKGRPIYSVIHELGTWTIGYDSSIEVAEEVRGHLNEDLYRCELVTPVLDVSQLDVLYRVLDELRYGGAVVNDTCGIHIHIDYKDSRKWLSGLIGKMHKQEMGNILDIFHVPLYRREKYCKAIPDYAYEGLQAVVDENYSKAEFLDTLYNLLGEGYDGSFKKNPARYYWVNFDSVFKRNTVEFRLFNATFCEKELKSYVSFVVNMVDL